MSWQVALVWHLFYNRLKCPLYKKNVIMGLKIKGLFVCYRYIPVCPDLACGQYLGVEDERDPGLLLVLSLPFTPSASI